MEHNTTDSDKLRNYLNSRNLPQQLSKWINEKDLLNFLGISPKTLSNWRSGRKIDFTKQEGITLYDGYALADQLDKKLKKRK
ncbi:MAG: hypothetical protein EKK37_16450 [Sphingobacteriales bacterium]|nr:MAG: hypothetical protein EKK37_16450 [Sphingobacteriales bacterium]